MTMQENDGVFMQKQYAEQIPPGEATKWRAQEVRNKAEAKLSLIFQVVLVHGTTEDVEAATKALSRVASKAMRRR